MTWVDAVLVVVFIVLVFHGMIIGLVRGLFDIAGLVLGYLLAVRFCDRIPLPGFLAFLAIFVAAVVALSLAGVLITKAIRKTPLSAFNRLLGALLGLAKAFLLGFVFLLVLQFFPGTAPARRQSDLAPYVRQYGLAAARHLPAPWSRWIVKKFEEKPAPKTDGKQPLL
jgi:membrane protein required for colicin V production